MPDNPMVTSSALLFSLDVEDGWPPVGAEDILCTQLPMGYRINGPPLFVKGISVGDVLTVTLTDEGQVDSWSILTKSDHSTIWLLRKATPNGIAAVVDKLLELGCQVVEAKQLGSYAVDVPPDCSMKDVDAVLASLDTSAAAVAFPSFRHAE